VTKLKTTEFVKYSDDYRWNGKANTIPNGPGTSFNGVEPQFVYGTQELAVSQGHPYHLLGKETGDIGGPFRVVAHEYEHASRYGHFRTSTDPDNGFAENFLGSFYAYRRQINDIHYPPPLIADDTLLDAMGATAISHVIPTNPLSGALVTLGELRSEGIPSLIGANTWKARTLRARNAGEEYLNYQFGWLPLVSEMSDFAHTVLQSDEIARKYEAESGKLLHRRFTYPVQISDAEVTEEETYPSPGMITGYWDARGKTTRTRTKRYETWFSGAFTYHLPPVGSNARDLAIANKLYGVRPSPEVVWNLTPWTWAVDWFSNAGDVIHNISAFSQDGLVMPYGYLMHKTVHEDFYEHSGSVSKTGGEIRVWQRLTTIVKQRQKATPYGFGLDIGSFSNRQWSILGALGLTRGSTGMKYE
jgi:hypothetical protein